MKSVVFTLLLLVFCASAQAGLKDYVQAPDGTYNYELVETRPAGTSTLEIVKLTSQIWQGIVWTHWLTIVRPAEVKYADKCLLLIDGGDNTDKAPDVSDDESKAMMMIANGTKSLVAILNQVPNQPLFGGLTEDQIIAYSEDEWLKTRDNSWPLLFPMVKSAVRAMDTIQAIAKEKHGQEVKNFVLTGGSKRGWTTWLSAATDARVSAIAPAVIDVLNMKPQMEHQLACYGAFSDEVAEYTERGLQAKMNTPAGQELLSMLDPYAYRGVLTLPKLVLLGTNDPYWTVDASSFYFPSLPGEKHLYYQDNTGHDSNLQGVGTIAQFYYNHLQGKAFPQLSWQRTDPNTIDVSWDVDGGEVLLWTAQSDNRDFRQSPFTSQKVEGARNATVHVATPEKGWTAFYVELRLTSDFAVPYGTTTEMTVVPQSLPHQDEVVKLAATPASAPAAAGEPESK